MIDVYKSKLRKYIEFLETRIYYGCYFFPADKDNLLEVIKQLKRKDKNGN